MAFIVGGAILGGSLISGLFGKKGAKQQAAAADAATAESRRQFDLTRQDAAPYIQAGQGAVGALSRLEGLYRGTGAPGAAPAGPGTPTPTGADGAPDYSGFYASPGYQFTRDQALDAVNRGAAASGKYNSGQRAMALQDRGAGLAAGEYDQFVNQLLATAGLGTTGTGISASAGANEASQVGNASMYKGAARASGYDAIGNAANSGINNLLFLKYMGGGTPAAAVPYSP